MNKLFTKIAALALGATMAVGVGVAVGSSNDAAPVNAASAWQAHTGAITAGNEYLIVAVSGSYSMNPANSTASGTTTKAAGGYSATSFTAASGPDRGFIFADAGSSTFYIKDGACFVRANGTTNNGLASATSNDTNPNYGIWTVTETSTSGQYTIINANNRQISLYSTTNWRSYGTTSGSKTNVKLYEKSATPQTITVDPASKEAYTDETFSLTTNATSASWALSNNTCGATLSAASGKTVSVSATGAGSVRVTATASGYTSPYVDLTFIERPTSPYITPEKSSTSGYTGLNETLSFAYGNLTSTLGVVSSNTSVVTVETPSYSAGEGTVQINFVGAGSTTVKFNDGSTELASVSVSVATSSVTITGLAATGNVYIGKTLDLGSTITVTATGTYSSDVTWESDDDSIATVSTSGVVSGVAAGSAGITVTSDDYPSATMTCTVTVSEAPLEYEIVFGTAEGTSGITDFSNTAYIIPSGVTLDNIQGNVYSNTSNQAASLRFGKSGTTGSFDATISSSYYITNVICNLKYYGSDTTAAFDVTPEGGSAVSKTLTSSFANYTYDVSSAKANKVTLGTSINGKRAYLTGFTIQYKANPVLDSVTTSGQTTSFTAGNTWSYGGTLTAHYTAGKADATVSPTSFKFGASGIDPTTSGTAITTNTTLDVATHNGKYIYVVYTEDTITKWASYQITVNYAPVTSVVIDTHAAEIGLNETYDYTLVGVTINTEYAQQGYEWVVSANTVNDDYYFDGSGLLSGDTEGTITLRCRSTADNSKYDELVVTVTGDPTAEFVKASTSGYVGKTEIIEFTYGNIDDVSKITVSSSNTSYVTVANDLVADEGEGLVTINFVAEGSANVTISYDGGETLDTLPVTVSADSVTALTWSAPTIKVYSGASTTVSDASSWNVHYTMASGDYGSLLYGEYTLKLGGSTITLPHTWDATDDGKVLSIEYAGFTSPTTSTVDVTQTLQAVNASDTSAWDYTFTAKAWSAAGSATLDDKEWTMSGTDDGSPYFGYDTTKGQQFGSGSHPYSDLTLSSSDFSGTIASITVYTSGASSINATVQVSVGGTAYGAAQTITATNTPYTFDLGGKSGTISIDYVNSSSKAIYIKEIVVNTVSGSHNIANASGHEAAQKAVVKFAKAFNAAMDTTAGCTTNMSSAWSTATTAWNTFTSEAAALGSTEEAYAKNLIKYATAQWTENTDSDYSYCLERAMATYEKCVSSYEMTAFMSTVRPVGRSVNINPISIIGSKSDFNVISIVVITSVISLTAIGGYFFLRKRKENI